MPVLATFLHPGFHLHPHGFEILILLGVCAAVAVGTVRHLRKGSERRSCVPSEAERT